MEMKILWQKNLFFAVRKERLQEAPFMACKKRFFNKD
jgi:hypothetical protein